MFIAVFDKTPTRSFHLMFVQWLVISR